ncbi:hypothetical protein HPB48_013127 [Haemaphysalis longicornis]|uniref:Palmitoyltransferase n=1 Tax=Haemaphysalis longicornis TaxID=44386 RepID=A0A9J6GVN8_HAELO|nr:hypothetical protein HPB48_013127 [Haemaphysalis longicornis]
MDHHCPWFNNCVSFSTQKSFLLTLAYGVLLGAYTALTALIPAVTAWFSLGLSFTTLNVSFLVASGVYFSIAAGAFLSSHLDYLYRNVTTLENMRAIVFRDQRDSFDLGREKNFRQVRSTFFCSLNTAHVSPQISRNTKRIHKQLLFISARIMVNKLNATNFSCSSTC